MSKRIQINHAEDLTPYEVVSAVKVCLLNEMCPGEVVTLTNRISVFYNDKTKNPSFYVWRNGK